MSKLHTLGSVIHIPILSCERIEVIGDHIGKFRSSVHTETDCLAQLTKCFDMDNACNCY